MIVHEIFAQVIKGRIENIVICENYPMADHLAKCIYGPEAYAVDCLQYRCMIGDLHHDNTFWRIDEETGEEVALEYIPTQEQQVASLTIENEELSSQLTVTQLALTEQYEENLLLQEEVTNTQSALTELYEASL